MPPVFFQKPETALKRAQELISVGKEIDALETLHDTIKSKRHKQWTKTHEQIMLKHVELCVSLRKAHMAKDAMFQYKALTQQVSTKSLETVTLCYLDLAQQKTEEAQKTSLEKVEEIEDLDMADAPENLLLSAVSGAAAQDRMDRTVLSPWLRFLWESYRNCLDLLRNNSVFEQLYHRIARQSFEFCLKYQRRTEFRKLCDHLRLHLTQIQKHQHLPHVVKLTSAESLTLMQDTRLIQLDTAIQMELWQEAYRSAEDVHGMMQLSKDKDKRMVKPASYVNYYDKLALVFWKADNRLFHAAALLQKFIIYKDMKKMFTAEEATDQATRVLLATLSIADGADNPSDLTRHLDIEEQHIANMRILSNLLRLPIAPTRAGILKEIARLNLPDIAHDSAKSLYCLLECDFTPLRLAASVQTELSKIQEMQKPEYDQYVSALHGVTATKIVKQMSLIYDTLSIKRVHEMIPFYNDIEFERFFVDICKHRYVRARIDHRDNCVHFCSADATLASAFEWEGSDGFIGDFAQVGIEGIRGHLELMHRQLREIVEILDADSLRTEALEHIKRHAEVYAYHKDNDYQRMLMRRKKIETYKETSERLKLEKSQQAQAEANRKEELRRAEEMRRLEQENIEKEKMRKQAEQEEIDRKVRAEKMKRIQATPIYQAIVKDHGEEAFQNMDPDSVLREQRDRLDEQRREQQARLQQQEKKFDHMVRAYHLHEMIERKKISDEYARTAPVLHEEYEKRRVFMAIQEHEEAVSTYERMQKVSSDAAAFLEIVKNNHREEFEKKMAEWAQRLQQEKKHRLAQRLEERKRIRREKWLQSRELEQKRAKEALEQARREELERERRAAREAQRQPKREQIDSAADSDVDWRKGAQPTAVRVPAVIQRQQTTDRIESERQRDNRPIFNQAASEADSGLWVRGQVTAGAKQQETPARGSLVMPRHQVSERDSARMNDTDHGNWRRGQTVKSYKESILNPADVRSATTASDTGIWRRGLTTVRQGGDGDVNIAHVSSSQTATSESNQSWRQRPRLVDGALAPSNGVSHSHEQDGSALGEITDLDNGGKWSHISPRNQQQQMRNRLAQTTTTRKTAENDRNWRKK